MENQEIKGTEAKKEVKKIKWGKILNVVFWIIIIVILFKVFQIVQFLKSEQAQCLDNGFVYAAQNQMKGEVQCSCTEIRDGQVYPFSFDEEGWYATPVEKPAFQFPTP